MRECPEEEVVACSPALSCSPSGTASDGRRRVPVPPVRRARGRHNLPFPVLVIKQPQDAAHVKHAAEAHVQLKSAAAESAGAAKAATTMAELRGEPKGQQQKEGGSAPLKVTTIPPAKEPQTPQHAHHS